MSRTGSRRHGRNGHGVTLLPITSMFFFSSQQVLRFCHYVVCFQLLLRCLLCESATALCLSFLFVYQEQGVCFFNCIDVPCLLLLCCLLICHRFVRFFFVLLPLLGKFCVLSLHSRFRPSSCLLRCGCVVVNLKPRVFCFGFCSQLVVFSIFQRVPLLPSAVVHCFSLMNPSQTLFRT